MKTKLAFAVLAGLTLLFSACSKDEITDDALSVKSSELSAGNGTGDCCTFTGDLTGADELGLLKMREEEKLAQDVYLTFYDTYGETVFQNIANSETAHTNAVLNLILGYGLEDPAIGGIGNFSDPDFVALFKQLTADGVENLVAALRAGAYIEELDITDLWGLLAETENQDLQNVYGHLESGSESHLRAFVTVLNSLGETYDPVILSAADYAEILSGSNGMHGQGNVQNGSNGNGQNSNNAYQGANGTGTCDGTQSGSPGKQGGNGYGK